VAVTVSTDNVRDMTVCGVRFSEVG
jgi:hypothetical protein